MYKIVVRFENEKGTPISRTFIKDIPDKERTRAKNVCKFLNYYANTGGINIDMVGFAVDKYEFVTEKEDKPITASDEKKLMSLLKKD